MKAGKPTGYLRIGTFPYVSIYKRGNAYGGQTEYVNLKLFMHETGAGQKRCKSLLACKNSEWQNFVAFILSPSTSQVHVDFNKRRGFMRIGPLKDGQVLFHYELSEDSRGKALSTSRWVALDDIWLPWSVDPIPSYVRKTVLLIGIPASGKSTFFKRRFFGRYTQISRDVLKTWNREQLLMNECFRYHESFVVDNTNVSIENRERFITPARRRVPRYRLLLQLESTGCPGTQSSA